MPDQPAGRDIDAREYRELYWTDLQLLYRPADEEPVSRLRDKIIEGGGLDRILMNPNVDGDLRKLVLRQLRLESLLELAFQAGIFDYEFFFDDRRFQTIGDLFSRRHPSFYRLANRWLPLLLSARRVNNRRFGFIPYGGSIDSAAERGFVSIVNLDATLRDDSDLYDLSQLLVHGQPPKQGALVSGFWSPERFVRVWASQADTSHDQEQGGAIRGIVRFLYLCRELSGVMRRLEGAPNFRVAVWQFHAGCFDQFLPTGAFVDALALSRSLLKQFDFWPRIIEVKGEDVTRFWAERPPMGEMDEDLKHDNETLDSLAPERYTPPEDWLRILDWYSSF